MQVSIPTVAQHPSGAQDDFGAIIDDFFQRLPDPRGALLPLLHRVQAEFGYIPGAAVGPIAHVLNLSRAEVHGAISFYHDFRTLPACAHTVKICRAEACRARGGQAVEAAAARAFGVKMGEERGDGRIALEPVYCLGLCATGPNALVDGRPLSRLDPPTIERLAEALGA